MKAGAGNATIKFTEELFPLEGFCGIHDLPKVSILIIEEKEKAAIVSIEIVMLWDDLVKKCKRAVADAAGIAEENVWIHITHAITTPHAPGGPLVGLGGDVVGTETKEENELLAKRILYEDAIVQAFGEALTGANEMLDAKLYVGSSACSLIEGRDIETPGGWWIGTKGVGESNDRMTILVFKGMDDRIIASLISCGMKPCVIDNAEMEKNKRLISADAPGLCCRELEEYFGAPMLYCTAAAGDRIPIKTAWYDRVQADGTIETVDLGVAKGIEFAKEISCEMAQTAKEIICSAKEMPVTGISQKRSSFSWETKKRVPMHPYQELAFEKEGKTNVPVEVLSFGNVALVGSKPELNAITEKQLQEKSGYEHTLFLSMVDGGMKYMPDMESYNRLSWEALASMLMPGAAEKFVDAAIELLEKDAAII